MRLLLRSPLLWLGLPGLLSLFWAWANSVTTASTLLIGRENIFVELKSGEGVIGVITCLDSPKLFTGWSFETQTIRTPWDFFSPSAFSGTLAARNYWAMEAAYWLIILLYLTFWILSLWLRHRVAKKLIAAHESDVPRGTN